MGDYEPYGKEWKKAMMIWSKTKLVDCQKICLKELTALREENTRLKQGICEHVEQDVIGSDCYLCEAAIAMKGYPKWVEKAKASREENEELKEEIADLRSIEKEHNHTMDVLEGRVKELEEECVGYLEISVQKNGKIRSLESKLKDFVEALEWRILTELDTNSSYDEWLEHDTNDRKMIKEFKALKKISEARGDSVAEGVADSGKGGE